MSIDFFPPSRREFLSTTSAGVGFFALAPLLQREGRRAGGGRSRRGETLPGSLLPRKPHFAPKAKAMISLFMHGGPSHVDLLDPKPELQRMHGREYTGDVAYSF